MTNGNFDTLDGASTIPGEPEGQILSGRYKIVRQLGSGGMGTVYLAKDMELDIDVAIKVLPTLLANNKSAIDNLRREAKTALTLSHPNIVRLHTFQSDEAIKYLVMEYVDGGSLEEKVSVAGALGIDETLRIFTQVAAGLDYAHSQKVLHRDIKPANIMLTKDGVAKLADFGIARQIKESMTRITGKETSGTMLYMAPEQFRGGEPDYRSDIYSLAASIYECLSGKPPFWRGSIEYQILHETPAPLNKLNDKQNTALLKALSKDPNGRQNNAKKLLTDLGIDLSTLTWQPAEPCVEKYSKDTLDYSKTIDTKLTKRKSKLKIAAVVGFFALITVIGLTATWHIAREKVNPPIEPPIAAPEKTAVHQNTSQETEQQEKERSFHNLMETGFINEAKQDWTLAIDAYAKASLIKPDDSEVKDKLSMCQHNLYLQQAEQAERQNDLQLAINNYTKALSFKQITSTQVKLSGAKEALAMRLEQQRKTEEYNKLLTQAQNAEKTNELSTAVELYKKAQEFTDESLSDKINSLNQQIMYQQEEAERQEKLSRRIAISANFENFPDGDPLLDGISIDAARYVDKNPYYKKSLRFLQDGAYLVASFSITKLPRSAKLNVVHLSSSEASCRNGGWAPITISLNDRTVVADHSPSSHGYMTESWDVTEFLKEGRNYIKFYFDNSCTHYWLQKFEIEGL